MIRANQDAVAHTANVNIVQIRQAEIAYFYTFFSSFGTQSALLVTIVYSNLQIVEISGCNIVFLWFYWVSTALCALYSIKALLSSLYLSVYGQGLALRGPVGSMVSAIEGMISEQQVIVTDYSLAIIFLTTGTIGIYFMLMTTSAAITCSTIAAIGAILWYNNVVRIYNRFKFEKGVDMTFKTNDNDINDPRIVNDNKTPRPKNKFNKKINISTNSTNNKVSSRLAGFFNRSNSSTTTANPIYNEEGKENDIYMAGYLTIKTKSESFTTIIKNYITNQQFVYRRRYIVLYNTLLYIYKSKRAFESSPEKPLRKRPIDLDGYKIHIPNNNDDSDESEYIIYLLPEDNEDDRAVVEFRCDTLAESLQWINVLNKAILLCDQADDNESTGDVMSVSRSLHSERSLGIES